MKIRTMVGLTLLGTAIYAHKQRGGDMSVGSIKRSLRDLWRGIQNTASDAKQRAEEFGEDIKDRGKAVASDVAGQNRSQDVEFRDEGFGSTGSTGYTGGGDIGHRP